MLPAHDTPTQHPARRGGAGAGRGGRHRAVHTLCQASVRPVCRPLAQARRRHHSMGQVRGISAAAATAAAAAAAAAAACASQQLRRGRAARQLSGWSGSGEACRERQRLQLTPRPLPRRAPRRHPSPLCSCARVCRGDNVVAIDLITEHIRLKLQQHDLRRIYPNLEVRMWGGLDWQSRGAPSRLLTPVLTPPTHPPTHPPIPMRTSGHPHQLSDQGHAHHHPRPQRPQG